MNITEYNEKIGKIVPAEKIGKYHYTLRTDESAGIIITDNLYYGVRVTNIEKEYVVKDTTFVPSRILFFKDKKIFFTQEDIDKIIDELREKILRYQSNNKETADSTKTSGTLILIEDAKKKKIKESYEN